MNKILIFTFILFIHINLNLTTNIPLIHKCQVETYTETINRSQCSTRALTITSTRCRGQCHSEDYLVYDWKLTPPYQHQHKIHCCSPNQTQIYQQRIRCDNQQIEIIQYRLINQCQCKTCTDHCFG